jgi:hypothetical protein
MPEPRGRRVATRGVFPLEDPGLLLPELVGFDTSFVVEVLIETQRLHVASADFLERLVEARRPIVTSELLEVDLAEAEVARLDRNCCSRRSTGSRSHSAASPPQPPR